jgi:Tol biopolymer transport system component
MSSDGLGNAKFTFGDKVMVWNINDVSPDGRYALYEDTSPRTSLWALPLFGQPKPFAYVQGKFRTYDGRFSPNGQYVAYTSDETGRPEIFVQTFPDHLHKWQVSTSGGTEPMWRRDGDELFYLKPDDTVMSVHVKTSASKFDAGIPRPLFKTQLVASGQRNHYTVSPDGERFLMIVPTGEARPEPITVVLNWPALLKKQ